MRDAALTALLRMYSDDDNLAPLHAFTTRFQSRCPRLCHTCTMHAGSLPTCMLRGRKMLDAAPDILHASHKQ